jgi:hypothetical protein
MLTFRRRLAWAQRILIPHLESPQEVAEADRLLTQLEDKRLSTTLQIVAVLIPPKGITTP